jgi:hypothetical protein
VIVVPGLVEADSIEKTKMAMEIASASLCAGKASFRAARSSAPRRPTKSGVSIAIRNSVAAATTRGRIRAFHVK